MVSPGASAPGARHRERAARGTAGGGISGPGFQGTRKARHPAHHLERRACVRGRSRGATHGSRPVGFRSENVTACIAALLRVRKKHLASQPTEPSQANWGVHTATPPAETFCQLTFREIIVNSCNTDMAFGALGCTAITPALLNAGTRGQTLSTQRLGCGLYLGLTSRDVRALPDLCWPCTEPAWAASAPPRWSPGEHLHGRPRA